MAHHQTLGKMKKLWALRYVVGIACALLMVSTGFVWAFQNHPRYVGAAILVVLALVILNQPRVRRERARTQALVDAALRDTYASLSSPPALKRSFSYGYPAFEVKFRSKAELEAATSMNDVFKAKIGEIFQNCGSRRRPFIAEKATFFTYDGQFAELIARAQNA